MCASAAWSGRQITSGASDNHLLFTLPSVYQFRPKIFVGMPLRAAIEEPNDQLEAIAVIVVEYDGANPAKLVTDSLAPPPHSPIHYANFICRIADLYVTRFSGQ
jgi:hypothetical protein